MERQPVLDVTDLTIAITANGTTTVPVSGVSVAVAPGEITGIVGESGCGKSTLLRAIAGVLPRGLRPVSGTIAVDGAILTPGQHSGDVAMIFQDPMTGLNPAMTVGEHVTEVPRARDKVSRAEAREMAVQLLREVGIADADRRLDDYPHQLSGGLRQRVLIAAALAGSPRLLLCDEPTTALDVTVQARFVALLRHLVETRGIGILYVTHDLPLLGTLCDSINVMYAGQIIERGSREEVLQSPRHPYTAALLAAAPRISSRADVLTPIPGQPPRLDQTLQGCRFRTRCVFAAPECATASRPGEARAGHETSCVRIHEIEPLVQGVRS